MWSTILVVFLAACTWRVVHANSCTLAPKGSPRFPANFSFGVSTSSYQIEGGWNTDGRGHSIWDDLIHDHPDLVADHSNADVAVDSYHRFDQDLQTLKELKVNHYSFSISWARIFPNGDISSRNQKGIDYYNNVIDKLLANGIEPMVTMFHYDLPSEIQKIGGFTNPLFIDLFVTYAIELFNIYGDRVKTWVTFCEPTEYCLRVYSYPIQNSEPDLHAPGVGEFLCVDISLKAHAIVYWLYRSRFHKIQGGKIGLIGISNFLYSRTNDSDVVKRGMDFYLGWMMNPIFGKYGGYPEVMVREILGNSLKEGRVRSRLPNLEGKWRWLLKGSADFFGINYYTSRYIKRASKPQGENPSWERDCDCEIEIDSNWLRANSNSLYCVPKGLEDLLKYVREEYGNVEIRILENGWSDNGELFDDQRIDYLRSHLQATLNAINEGINIRSYSYFTLMDSFEWLNGYTKKYGLYAVNMTSPNLERTAKKSAFYYRNVIENRTLPRNFD